MTTTIPQRGVFDPTSAAAADEAVWLSGSDLLLRFLRSLRVIALVALVATTAVVGYLLVRPRTFMATVQLATISPRAQAASATLAAALGGLQGTGVQATPTLIVELSRTNEVLYNVGTTVSADLGGRRLVDRLDNRPPDSPVPDELVAEKVRARTQSAADLQTGLIRISITHRDSAVARRAAIRMVEEVNKAYLAASHAQAKAIAAAQGNRVDSAASRLTRAENQLLEFIRGNRAGLPYSESALGRTRLERERDFAQSLYTQAVNDRDAAVGRALEETPALIVIDPVPARLKPESRGVVVKAILTVLAVLALSLLWLLAQMKRDALARSPSPADRRLAAALTLGRGPRDGGPRARGA